MKSFLSFHRLSPLAGLPLIALDGRAQSIPEAQAPASLGSIVGEISANNPELKFYEAEIAAAKAGVRSASSYNNPELSLDLGRKWTGYAMVIFVTSSLALIAWGFLQPESEGIGMQNVVLLAINSVGVWRYLLSPHRKEMARKQAEERAPA